MSSLLRLLKSYRLILPFFRLIWRLLGDRRVPLVLKSLPLLAAAYLVMPRDFIADWIPILGHVDDIVVVALLLVAFVVLAPKEAVLAGLGRSSEPPRDDEAGSPTIEGRYRYVDRD